jgi:hypothetical protein
MTLILRNSSAQARIEGRNPALWPDGDFIVVDTDIPVGRIYRELVSGERKWLWSIHQIPGYPRHFRNHSKASGWSDRQVICLRCAQIACHRSQSSVLYATAGAGSAEVRKSKHDHSSPECPAAGSGCKACRCHVITCWPIQAAASAPGSPEWPAKCPTARGRNAAFVECRRNACLRRYARRYVARR